jgi:polysaccharide biosynthesis transport protein
MDPETQLSLLAAPQGIRKHPESSPAAYKNVDIQQAPHLGKYWTVIRKRYATVLTTLFVVFTTALIATLKEKPTYEAKTLIEIQKEDPDIPSLQELFQLDTISDTYLETQDRILKSDDLARRVIVRLHLAQFPEFGARTMAPAAQSENQPPLVSPSASDLNAVADEALKKFQQRLSVEPVKRSRLIEITFDSDDPALAAQVANAVVSTYIQQNLASRWQVSQSATEWLQQELLDMKAKLEQSQDNLQQYAHDNGLVFLETDQGNTENISVQGLRELEQELTKAQADRYHYESLYRLVQQGNYASLPGVFDNKLLQDLTEKLADLERERSRLASEFNPEYPRLKEIQSQIDEGESELASERQRGAQLIEDNYQAALDRENMLRQAFEEQKKQANDIAEKSVQYNILKREADTNKQLYVDLLEKMKETAVSTSLKATNIRIVDTAHRPRKPDRPRVFLNLSTAAAFGLFLGIGFVFLQEHLDDAFKSGQEAEQFLQLPSLGSIPRITAANGSVAHKLYRRALSSGRESGGENGLSNWNRIEGNGQNPLLAEAVHGLRTSVLLSRAKCPPESLLVTSAQPGEGKTTVAANLAISMAQLGHSVLLVDADLRRPNLHKFFGISSEKGLVDFLTGQADWRSLTWKAPSTGLSVLPCGSIPPNPTDLLSSDYMREMIRDARKEYKFVVLDSAPLAELADSRILATLVDGVILVIGCGTTPRYLVHRAYTSTLDTSSRVLGIAINFAEPTSGYGYYGYKYTNPGDLASP